MNRSQPSILQTPKEHARRAAEAATCHQLLTMRARTADPDTAYYLKGEAERQRNRALYEMALMFEAMSLLGKLGLPYDSTDPQ